MGGFGGCWGTISPLLIGTLWGRDISPADRNDIMPVFSLACDVKQTRPPYFFLFFGRKI